MCLACTLKKKKKNKKNRKSSWSGASSCEKVKSNLLSQKRVVFFFPFFGE